MTYCCTNGHDLCREMYPGRECPYCERAPLKRSPKKAEDIIAAGVAGFEANRKHRESIRRLRLVNLWVRT